MRVVFVGTFVVLIAGFFAWRAEYLERLPPPALLLLGLSIYSLVQSCPLPIPLLRTLSPKAATVWAFAVSPFKQELTFGSLSLDPGASSVEAAKFASYALAFAIAAAYARRRGAAPVIALVFTSAVILTLTTLAHAVLGATSVFGVYVPKFAQPGIRLGPMLNANCLAGYLVLGTLCGLGLAFSQASVNARILYFTGAMLMTGGVAVSGSRAGFAALLLAATAFGLFAATRLEYRTYRLDWRVVAGIAGTLVLATSLALALVPGSWELLVQTDVQKLRMWSWVLPMVRDYPVFGVGRGAFESAFSKYKPPVDTLTYSHPENIVAQWTTEWGVIGVAALAALVWLMRPRGLGLRKHPAALGAMIGVAAITLQNLLDLGLELFSSMLAVVVLMGACWGQTPKRPGTWRLSAWSRVAVLVLGSTAVAAAAWRGREPLELERATLAASSETIARSDERAQQAFFRAVKSAMLRHPAEYYIPRLAAFVTLQSGGNVLPWIGRALELCETDSRSHWILAVALHRHGLLSQALLEARLSVEYDENLAATVGSTVAHWSQRFEDLERAAPPGAAGAAVLYAELAALPGGPLADLRERLLREGIKRDPASELLRVRLANELLARFTSDFCAGDQRSWCTSEISSLAATLERLAPESALGSEIRAGLYTQTRQFAEAERVLTPRCGSLEGQQQYRCWDALLTVALADVDDKAFVGRVARRLVHFACVEDESCAAGLLRAGEAMGRISEWLDALAYFERAATRAPTVTTLLHVADAGGALGRGAVVERALSMARARAQGNAALLDTVEQKRRSLEHKRME